MHQSPRARLPGAVVVSFPRFSRTRPRPSSLGSSPEFDAGFDAGIDFAFTLVRQLQARGQFSPQQGA